MHILHAHNAEGIMSILKRNNKNSGKKVKLTKQRVKFKKPSGKGYSKAGRKVTLQRVIASIVTLGIVGFIGGFALMIIWMAQAPELDLDKFNYASSTKLLDRNGKYYQQLQGSEYREPVSIDEIPEVVQLAFVAIEDKRFYDHHGVDFIGTGKAVLGVLTTGSTSGPGGSTITQQLIKLTHLTSETSIKRKVQEWKLAVELERKFTKEQILEAYLNKVNMSQAWGIQAASKYFFKKDVSKLSVAQAAVLASIINAPTYYNPLKYEDKDGDGKYTLKKTKNADGKVVLAHDKNNRDRALTVVERMHAQGHISDKEYQVAVNDLKKNRIGLTRNETQMVYSFFTDAVYNEVVKDIAEKYNYSTDDAESFLLNNGLTIKTTLDRKVQKALEKTATENSIFPGSSSAAQQASRAMTKKKGKKVKYKPQVGMTIIENKTGYVVGIVGGRTKNASRSLNRATQKFQPGSSTKPLTAYGPGIDTGAITAGTAFNDTVLRIGGWSPKNSGGGYQGMMTVRKGLTNSVNTIAVQAMMQTGTETIIPYAKKLGLEIVTAKNDSEYNDENPAALALGGYTHGQSTYNMASAYTTFANKGIRQTPIMYTEVTDKNGEVIISKKSKKVKVFDEGTAFIITSILKDVVKGGTTYISIPGTQVAGKTGTTDQNRHAWFCGYTPEYSGAVWYGYDQNVVKVGGSTYHLNIGTYGGSSNGPAAFWRSAFTKIYASRKVKKANFDAAPSDVYKASVDGVSGKSPTALSSKDPRGSKVYSEYFLKGKGPNGKDDIHVAANICTSSKKKATQYCPKDHVKKSCLLDLSKIEYPPGVTGKNEIGSQAKYSLKKSKCDVHNKHSIQSITLAVSPASIEVGETASATVTATLADGSSKNVSARLSSGNSRVASISGGSVLGTGGGSTTITATVTQNGETFTAKDSITVKGKAISVDNFYLDRSSETVSVGQNYTTPTATVALSDGSTASGEVSLVSDGGFDKNTPGDYELTFSVSYNGSTLGNLSYTVTVSGNGGKKPDGKKTSDIGIGNMFSQKHFLSAVF